MSGEGSTASFVPRDRVPLLGLGAMAGGVSLGLWMTIVLVNPTGGYVGYLDPIWVLWNLGIGSSVLGLYGRLAARRPRASAIGTGIAATGVTLSILSALVGAVELLPGGGASDPVSELGFVLAVVGFLGTLLGSFVLGIVALRDDVVPRRVASSLLVGSVLALGVNDTDLRVLFLLPYALAWVAVGYELWTLRSADGET